VGLGLREPGEFGEGSSGVLPPDNSLLATLAKNASPTSRSSQLVMAPAAPPWVDTSDLEEVRTWTA
jgi:hypothetical protein